MLRILEVKGKEAESFLHRITAGTVKGLLKKQGRAGLLLNGQSRVLAQFDLLRWDETLFLLAAPLECAAELAESLERVHFSEELEIRLTDKLVGVVNGEGGLRQEPFSISDDLAWASPVPGFRFDSRAVDAPDGFEFARIGALVPWPGKEWTIGENAALEAGMLPWIDRFKGCYPGQEVVELSLNVGHPARVLLSVEADAATAWDGGVITSSVQENGKWRALVRVPWGKRELLPTGISRIKSHW